MNSGSWDATVEGTQNFVSYSDHGDMSQDLEENAYQVASLDDYSQQPKWSLSGAPAMQRTVSRSSASSFKNRTVRASSQRNRPRIQTDVSQGAPTSAFNTAGSASLSASGYGMASDSYSTNGTMAAVSTSYFQDASIVAQNDQLLQQPFFPLYAPSMAPSLTSAYGQDLFSGDLGSSLDHPVQQHVDPACTQRNADYDTSPVGSPLAMESRSSRRSSLDIPSDDVWSYRPDSSPAESHDSNFGQAMSSDESMPSAMANDFGSSATTRQRSSSESDTVRDHPLYKGAVAGADGLYHCPWESESNCNHKPEKLKCNYDKFVDSHLKPYRCKNVMCENTRFSSTACLLRHEREAHAMHGHGDKPYRCTYEGCERSTPGNGFPRQWNLKDHMRRVHHDDSPQPSAAQPSPPRNSSSQSLSKNRKRKKDSVSSHGSSSSPASRKASSRVSKSQQSSAAAEAENSRSQAHIQAAAAKAQQLDQSFKMWSEHTASLRDIVGNFSQPYALQTFQQLQDARTQLSYLEQIHHNMAQSQGTADLGVYGHSQQLG